MKRIVLVILLTVFTIGGARAQVESRSLPSYDVPEFYVEALSFAYGDSILSRIDIYVQVPYEAIRFVKTDNAFSARYEITANFLAPDNASLLEKDWTEEIRLTDFDLTTSRKAYSLTQRSVSVPSGVYTLRVILRDLESKKVATIVKKMAIENYSLHSFSMSDVMLVSKVSGADSKVSITPNISGNISDANNALYLFFEVYTPPKTDSIEIFYTVQGVKGELKYSQRNVYRASDSKTSIVEKMDSGRYGVGAYTILAEAKLYGASTDGYPLSITKQRKFVVRWGNLPLTITDLDLAIKQLRYIAKGNEYDAFEEAKSFEEKQKLFQEFWRKRDPSPDTKRNEAMEEYYSRVEYANEHFSHYLSGWKTDMGMVFILFGAPNNVERHPFDIDSKPYEIWSYYDFNRQIVFMDETGFGDYRLLTPIWDLLQRLKY